MNKVTGCAVFGAQIDTWIYVISELIRGKQPKKTQLCTRAVEVRPLSVILIPDRQYKSIHPSFPAGVRVTLRRGAVPAHPGPDGC
jgi:hypothetical protein